MSGQSFGGWADENPELAQDWVDVDNAEWQTDGANREALSLAEFLLARFAKDEVQIKKRDLFFETWATRSRLLAECEAKRQIVEMYVGPTEDDEGNLYAIGGYGEAWVDAIKFLALPYADHPDYREEWRP